MKNIILLLILALFTNIINAQEKKEYYDNGQLKSIENYVDTIEHGSFIYYYENGTISVEGTMKNGELEGAYSEYNKKGQLKEFTTYKNGYKVGPFKTFWEAGELKEEGTYRSVYFFDGEYDETIRTGVYKAYLPNGDIAISVKLGVNEDNEEIGIGKGIENDYYATDDPYKFILAEESSLLDGEYHGVSKKYYENGQLKEIGEFNKGEEVGIHKEYYDNGQLKSNITFVDGNKIGLHEEYLENGSPSKKGNNGKKVGGFGAYYGEIGDWTYWEYYSNGQLEKKYTKEQNGDYTGNYEGYYENGQLWLKGKFVDDEKEGEWYQFEDGEKYKFFYENGELVKSKKVNSINDPIEDQFYKL